MRNTDGSRTIARASATRWRWPPERWRGRRSSRCWISSDSATRCDAGALLGLARGRGCAAGSRCSRPRSCAGRARSSGRPSRRRGRAAGCASRRGRRCGRCPRSAARGPRGRAARSSCRSPTARAARGTRRRARRGRASAARATAASKRFSMPRKLTSLMPASAARSTRARSARRARSSRCSTWRPSLTAASSSSAARAPIVAASWRTVVSRMRWCEASGTSSKPTTETSSGTRRPRRSSESIRSMATPSFMQQMAVGSSSTRPRAGCACARPSEKACGGGRPRPRARAGGRTRSARGRGRRGSRRRRPSPPPRRCRSRPRAGRASPPNEASIVGTPRSSRSPRLVEPSARAAKMTPSTRRATSARHCAASIAGSPSVSAIRTA